jgi:hypothetical protein
MRKQTDGLLSILGCLKDNSPRAFGTAIRRDIDIGPDDVASRAEQVFEILPTRLIRELGQIIRSQRKRHD